MKSHLEISLLIIAALQWGVAALNLGLERIMKWEADMARMPRLIREVHNVHSWFVSLTLAIFAAFTWRFSTELAWGKNPACAWIAGSIGFFWGFRTILQVAYYSSSHWRGRLGRTVIHGVLLVMYGSFACAYLRAAFR